MGKNFKNLIASLVLLGLVLAPLSFYPRTVHAQNLNPTGYTSYSNYGYGEQGGEGIVGYISGLANVITKLPLCKARLASAIKHLFDPRANPATAAIASLPIKGVVSSARTNGIGDIKPSQQTLDAVAKAQAVQTSNPALEGKVDTVIVEVGEIKKSTESLDNNDSCLNSIAKLVIKRLIQKVTLSTVAWIQNGFEGNPAYIENPREYFRSLGREEILAFGTEISDQSIFPYGKNFMIRQANYFNRRFQENARYSLNEVIYDQSGYSARDFQGDFSKGGWGGWLGMTTIPANNPLGFELLAAEELGGRVSGAVDDINSALQQADGFLGDQRCRDPKGLTREEHVAALEANKPEEGCIGGWEYVTPGKMISEAATGLVPFGEKSLVEAETINDAVALLIDSLIARWTQDLTQKGFAGIGTEGKEGYLIIDQDQFYNNYVPTQVDSDFLASSIRGWLADHPHFNIRTDLTQALIDEQRTYTSKLQDQNKVIEDLIKTIHQLDYCIPGPHPGWEDDSRRILSAAENAIVSKTPADMNGWKDGDVAKAITGIGVAAGSAIGAALTAGALAGSVIPGIGTAIGIGIGLIVGLLVNLFGGPSNEELLASYYAGIAREFTGIHVDSTGKDSAKLVNKHEVTNGLDKLFEQYKELIYKYFTPGFLPTLAPEAAIKFRQIPGYKGIVDDNMEQAVVLNGVIQRLGALKEEVDSLNASLPPAGPNSPTTEQLDEYEAKLKPLITEFARLSEDMVSGDDIAYLDNSLKQTRGEIKYVYEELIVGPRGCEQDLQFNRQPVLAIDPTTYPPINPPVDPTKTTLLRSTLRAEYPFKLWYDYDAYDGTTKRYPPGATLPIPAGILQYLDPTNLPTPNKMPSYEIGSHGPGFLSAVYFSYTDRIGEGESGFSCTKRPLWHYELDCIDAVDAFREIDSWPVSVGRNKYLNISGGEAADAMGHNGQKDVSFEQMFYIY